MIWSPAVLDLWGRAEPADRAGDYLKVAGWGILPALLVMVLNPTAALERTQVVLWITLLAAGVTANYALIWQLGRAGTWRDGAVGSGHEQCVR